jgi:hypothetical protein
MKKCIMMLTASVLFAVHAMSQQCDTLRGNLTSMTLTPSTNYVLEGVVVVPDGETLTIRPGVTICALPDAGLVIEKGGTIDAIGKADSFITFTSVKAPGLRMPGDWRGIVILGKANNNYIDGGHNLLPFNRGSVTYYGGDTPLSDDNDNSGSMAYVSIEFAGQNYTGDNYKGALLLNSVGSGTIMHHVQVLNPLNAGLTLLGGKVDAQDIYIHNAEKVDVYIEYGYRGTLTDVLAIKNPTMQTIATDAIGIYVSNHSGQVMNTPFTNPTIDAFTSIGPQQCDEDDNDNSVGIYFNNNARGVLKNGVVSGYNTGLYINDDESAKRTKDPSLILNYISFINNIIDNDHGSFLWDFNFMCNVSMNDWLNNDICGSSESIEKGNMSLNYHNTICGNYCNVAPTFSLDNSDIQFRESSSLKVGVLQEDPVFTWVQACPAATCCEASPQARILPLEAYPNPVQHTVTMVVPDVKDQQVKVQVIEMATGRIFHQQVQAKEAQLNIDMSKLPQGNYKIQMVTEQATYQTTIHKD